MTTTSPASKRLHVVTGKGGTGKTTVAAALALALAGRDQKVLLVEVEGRQGLARLFGVDSLGYREEPLATGVGGGQVLGMAVEPRAAIVEYLSTHYRAGLGARVLEKVGAVDFATNIAPGLRDVLVTGKVYEATRRQDKHGFSYDAVVVDAPPTGRVGSFLNVTAEVTGLARVGPVHQQATKVMELLRSPVTAVHVVALLEDLPVQETLDAVAELTDLGLPLGVLLLNQVRPARFAPDTARHALAGTLDAPALRRSLTGTGLPDVDDLVVGLLDQAAEHALNLQAQDVHRRNLADTGLPLVTLPELPQPLGEAGLARLAELLAGEDL